MIATVTQDIARHRTLLLGAGVVLAVVLLLLLIRPAVRLARRVPAGTPWFYYLASAGGLAVSLNTSWRFFGERLGVVGAERVVMFSVVELALVACALGMRANVRRVDPETGRTGGPGAPRAVAWVLCALSGYAALLLSGPVDGVARVALGPLLSLVMLHLALGIEIKNRTEVRTGTWARVVGEVRERVLSRLGLADDRRDALTRTRERAARRVAVLALARRSGVRDARLSRALRASNVAHDEGVQRRMLAELAVLRHAGELASLPLPSPWAPSLLPPLVAVQPVEPVVAAPVPVVETVVEPVVEPEPKPEPVVVPVARSGSNGSGRPRSASNGVSVPLPMSLPAPKGRAVNGSNGHAVRVADEPVTPASGGEDRPEPEPEPEPVVERVEPDFVYEPIRRVRPDREDTYATGMLDGVLLAAHTSPEWASEASAEAAIDLADDLLPHRSPRALVAALAEIGVAIEESSVRRRREERD